MQLEETAERRYQTKQEMVYHTLRDAIMRCQLQPGQRLVIEDIAQRLKVSHIPVREALQLLQSESLVVNIPHIGATVASLSSDSVIEVFTLMEGLEIVATRTAAARLLPEHEDQLTNLLASMDDAVQHSRHEQWADLNTAFHRTIASITTMPMLQEMTDRTLDQWDRVRRYFFNSVLLQRLDQAQQQHHAIFQAMRNQQFATLEQLVKEHNQGALAAYMDHISRTT